MATWGTVTGAFSLKPGYYLEVNTSRAGVVGNTSAWAWSIYVVKSGGGSGAWDLYPNYWSVSLFGNTYSGSTTLDFRNGVTRVFIASGTSPYVAHTADGYLTFSFSGTFSSDSFGYASAAGTVYADRIPKAPYAPAAPTFVSATASVLNFSLPVPADDGGATIIDYYMELQRVSDSVVVQTRTGTSGAQSFVGLDPNVQYRLRHRGRNSVGNGTFSPYTSATTLVAPPGAPTALAPTNLAPTSLTLGWTAPAVTGGGAITGYRVTRALNPEFTLGVSQFTQGNVVSRAFADLLPSTAYYFKVEATNSAGYGPASSTLAVTTVSGVYYSTGSAWLPCGVFVSDGDDWVPAELFVSDGTTYVAAI